MALDSQISNIFVFSWPSLAFTLMARNLLSIGSHLGALHAKEKRESHNESGPLTPTIH